MALVWNETAMVHEVALVREASLKAQVWREPATAQGQGSLGPRSCLGPGGQSLCARLEEHLPLPQNMVALAGEALANLHNW